MSGTKSLESKDVAGASVAATAPLMQHQDRQDRQDHQDRTDETNTLMLSGDILLRVVLPFLDRVETSEFVVTSRGHHDLVSKARTEAHEACVRAIQQSRWRDVVRFGFQAHTLLCRASADLIESHLGRLQIVGDTDDNIAVWRSIAVKARHWAELIQDRRRYYQDDNLLRVLLRDLLFLTKLSRTLFDCLVEANDAVSLYLQGVRHMDAQMIERSADLGHAGAAYREFLRTRSAARLHSAHELGSNDASLELTDFGPDRYGVDSVKVLETASARGSVKARLMLDEMYMYGGGNGVEKSIARSDYWFDRAIETRECTSEVLRACKRHVEHGYLELGLRRLRSATAVHYAECRNYLADLIYTGYESSPPDYKEAYGFYSTTIERPDSPIVARLDAYRRLGKMLEVGHGVAQSISGAVAMYAEADSIMSRFAPIAAMLVHHEAEVVGSFCAPSGGVAPGIAAPDIAAAPGAVDPAARAAAVAGIVGGAAVEGGLSRLLEGCAKLRYESHQQPETYAAAARLLMKQGLGRYAQEAYHLFDLAAVSADARFQMGVMERDGVGTRRNKAAARRSFEAAKAMGHPDATTALRLLRAKRKSTASAGAGAGAGAGAPDPEPDSPRRKRPRR